MDAPQPQIALIVGSGSGLSASLARLFTREGMAVALAARNPDKLAASVRRDRRAGLRLRRHATPPGREPVRRGRRADRRARRRGLQCGGPGRRAVRRTVPAQVQAALAAGAFGGFLVAQQAVRRMLPRGHGAVLFTGASASVKGYRNRRRSRWASSRCAGWPRAWRASSAPQGIHVAHFIIDGAIRNPGRTEPPDRPDSMLDPDAIAQNYLHVLRQPRSAWTWEMELRPWVEKF